MLGPKLETAHDLIGRERRSLGYDFVILVL